MAQRVTIIVERQAENRFKVVRVKNALSPIPGQKLDAKAVEAFITKGVEVIIDAPRKRA